MRPVIVMLAAAATWLVSGPVAAQRCSELAAESLEQAVCKAEATRAMADRGGPPARALYAAYAMDVVHIWHRWGAPACEEQAASCNAHAGRLVEAARAYQLARVVGRSIQLARVVVDAKTGVSDPQISFDAARVAADCYRTLGWVDKGIELMLSVAERHPHAPRAIDMVLDAHRLAHALGDRTGAKSIEAKFAQHYGTNQPAHRRQLDLLAAMASAADGDFAAVITRLDKTLAKSQTAPTRWQLEARTLLARAHRSEGDDEKARTLDTDVVGRWRAMQKTNERASWGHVEAVAESLLRVGDRAAERAKAVRPRAALPAWLTRHRDRELRDALTAYDAIDALTPAARPRFRVAAALGRARVLHELDERIRAAVPTATAELSRSSDDARAAYAACVALSTKLYHYDESALACENGLSALAPEQTFEGLWIMPALPDARFPQPPIVDEKAEPHPKPRWREQREETP